MLLTLKSVSMYTYIYTFVYIKVSAVASVAAFERDALVMIITAMEQPSNGKKSQRTENIAACAQLRASRSVPCMLRVSTFSAVVK